MTCGIASVSWMSGRTIFAAGRASRTWRISRSRDCSAERLRNSPRQSQLAGLKPYWRGARWSGSLSNIIGGAKHEPPTAADQPQQFPQVGGRSEEHTSELQSLMRISYAVFCLKKKNNHKNRTTDHTIPHLQHEYTNEIAG